ASIEELAKLRAEIAVLRSEIASLKKTSDQHLNWFTEAWEDISDLKAEKTSFEPSSPGPYHYHRLNTAVGPMLVSLGTVEPYLDGYKVALEIGKPLSGTFLRF